MRMLHNKVFFNVTYRENYVLLNSAQELAASDLFAKFTRSINFYTFYCHILKSRDV